MLKLRPSYFVNAIVYARVPELLGPYGLGSLVASKGLDEFIFRLTSNPLYAHLREKDLRDPLVFEKSLFAGIIAEAEDLSKYSRGLREATEYYLLPYRAKNLALLAASKASGLEWEEVSNLLLPDPFLSGGFYEALYSLGLKGIIGYLEEGVLKGASEALSAFKVWKDPTVIEGVIVRLGYEKRAAYFSSLRNVGGGRLYDAILAEVDVMNILTVYKGKLMGSPIEVVNANLIRAGRLYPARLARALELASPEEVIRYFRGTEYGALLEGLRAGAEVGLQVGARLNKFLYRDLWEALANYSDPLLPLVYLKLREIEAEAVRKIYHFKRLGLEESKLEELIF